MISIYNIAFDLTFLFIETIKIEISRFFFKQFSISIDVYHEILEAREPNYKNIILYVSKENFEVFKFKNDTGDYEMKTQLFDKNGKIDFTIHLEIKTINGMTKPFFI